MNKKEIDRYEIIQRVINKQITQIKAAELLKISPRRLRKLQRCVETYGPQGVISRSRGQPGNRRKPQLLKQKALALIQERFEGWGPTLIAEKLESWHTIKLSEETIRLWMIETHLWIPKESRKATHLMRGMKVEIVVYPNGAMRVFLQNREVEVKLLQECEVPIECTRKEVVWRANRRGHRSPPSTHPWKRTRVHL